MTRHRYKVEFTRDEDDVIIAHCPALDCTSDGVTHDEALANIRDCMALVVESNRDFGEPIPDDETGSDAIVFEA